LKLLRQQIWVLALAACSTAPTEPLGFRIQIEPNAAVITAGDTLRVHVTITNETSVPQQIASISCHAIVEVFPQEASAALPVHDSRACPAVAGTTTLFPGSTLADLHRLVTTTTPGTSNALAPGKYRVQAQFGVVGQGLARSDFTTVTVSR
jgi:hypothetical protein